MASHNKSFNKVGCAFVIFKLALTLLISYALALFAIGTLIRGITNLLTFGIETSYVANIALAFVCLSLSAKILLHEERTIK